MPPPSQHTLSNLKSIHLFRALLRETTYLPDSNARNYFHRLIVDRFKSYQPGRGSRRHASIINDRTRTMQKKARKSLNYLRRANQGEQQCLEKVMLFTYGRVGKRRYALLDQIMRPDPILEGDDGLITRADELYPLQKHYYSNKRFLQFFNVPKPVSEKDATIDISPLFAKLKAVVQSQATHGISIGRELRGSLLKTSIYNVWERPMPIKRARNDVRRWYKVTMSRLLPPLPVDEWDQLQALAFGTTKWTDFVARRTTVADSESEAADQAVSSTDIIKKGMVLDKLSKADRPSGKQRPHSITPKMMRRLYGRIFGLTCKLEWNEKRQKWTAEWGSLKDKYPHAYTAPVDEALFAGVDKKGQLIRDEVNSSQRRAAILDQALPHGLIAADVATAQISNSDPRYGLSG